ncbi:unnamed protein product [Urochloa decumbens]|uniref:TF-B3 domain-containing protein n=1 Tax=Urochloa decumbens TaxID=240449 RepID=A0ABC9CFD8_9POAL
MAPPAAAAKQTRVLLPFTSDALRIPDELAAEIGGDEAIVLGATGGKARPWPVEVGRDGDGAFLGRGWREFAAACGVEPGWRLVLRHRGRGVLTLKVFDDECCCLRELVGAQPPSAAAEATASSQDTAHKPQFLRVFPKDFMQKMQIPAKFVQRYIPKEHLDNPMAIVSGPLGKVSPIELQMNQLEVFFGGGWSQFLVFHDIAEANSLLLRYEGNMVFTVKIFEPDGCQRQSIHKDIRMRQISTLPDIQERHEELSVSIQKHGNSYWPSSNGRKRQKGPMTGPKKAPLWKKSFFKIEPPSWIKKELNANSLKGELALAAAFCGAIGLPEQCTITLKTSMSSTESWQVHALLSKKGSYQVRKGWGTFCNENSLKLGDLCTFNVVETTLWHVVVTRCKETISQLCYQGHPSVSSRMRMSKNKWSGSKRNKRPKGSRSFLNKAAFHRKSFYEIGHPSWIKKVINAHTLENHLENPCASSMKRKRENKRSNSQEQKRPKGSMTSWDKASSKIGCIFEIGPPAWAKKEINTGSMKNNTLYLPPVFYEAIGIRKPCRITLKTSMSSSTSWQAHVRPYNHSSHHVTGLKGFYQDNGIKVGDVCTFKVIETTLWHVIIEPQ